MINLEEIFKDKALKPKEKTELLCQSVIEKKVSVKELLSFADASKDPVKATCIEVIEFVSRIEPKRMSEEAFDYALNHLSAKAPRIKWESAKVIGNTCAIYPARLEEAVTLLIKNAKDNGTVVRWSAAFALGEILKLKLPVLKDLLPRLIKLSEEEEKNSIKKIYQAAIKKTNPGNGKK